MRRYFLLGMALVTTFVAGLMIGRSNKTFSGDPFPAIRGQEVQISQPDPTSASGRRVAKMRLYRVIGNLPQPEPEGPFDPNKAWGIHVHNGQSITTIHLLEE